MPCHLFFVNHDRDIRICIHTLVALLRDGKEVFLFCGLSWRQASPSTNSRNMLYMHAYKDTYTSCNYRQHTYRLYILSLVKMCFAAGLLLHARMHNPARPARAPSIDRDSDVLMCLLASATRRGAVVLSALLRFFLAFAC
jgi:hypothetical protein